ncbi:hypothetical protein H8711_01550 [Clostridiaceae bacterium NSJ-31]|uniref:Uncharacterized protein n=1 Tax=Ligaoa zhengdingensis TaxID=2763658 RepID=A0A926DXF3_9FIRM|nr:DUF6514 family protein [Ligaoa zhengdingensis]MBC8545622.1 hypothetical protein [Ligaoa zhengdingensis]
MKFVTTEEETLIEEEIHRTYGIRCGDLYIPNISLHKDIVSQLVQQMNQLEIPPLHAVDVIEDWLGNNDNI